MNNKVIRNDTITIPVGDGWPLHEVQPRYGSPAHNRGYPLWLGGHLLRY